MTSGVVILQKIDDSKIRQARELRRNMTDAERFLWEQLRGRKLAGLKFRRQQVIDGFIADFFCDSAKLVVEVDGGIHETEEQKQIDQHRRAVFVARGLKEIRFSNKAVLERIEEVLAGIKTAVGM